MKSKLDKILYWFELAVYDMETARAMLKTRRYLYVGFMCHQVIEKSLKAYYWYQKGTEPPFSHNLLLLAEKSGIDPVMTDEQRNLLYILMPFEIQPLSTIPPPKQIVNNGNFRRFILHLSLDKLLKRSVYVPFILLSAPPY